MSDVYIKYYLYNITYYPVSAFLKVLPAGEHSFPFSMILPNDLPSSFEGQYGYVRYTVEATLDPLLKDDNEVKAAFTVLLLLDLNLDPLNRVSTEYVSQLN
jgi:sporulation-control protein spo0M